MVRKAFGREFGEKHSFSPSQPYPIAVKIYGKLESSVFTLSFNGILSGAG